MDVCPAASLPVDRCSIRDRRRLLDDYLRVPRPVVIPDFSAAWPARRRWTPEFFEARYGAVAGEAEGRPFTVAQYLALMRDPAAGPVPYPFNFDMLQHFPELVADVQPQMPLGEIDRPAHPLMWKRLLRGTRPHELFFGGRGSVFRRLHHDALFLHGHITQLLGDKEFFIYPPEQTPMMYPRADNTKLSQIEDPLAPDLERFPRFAEARPYHTVLREGETIFFPGGWWHFTCIDGPCISYGGIGLTEVNWQAFIDDNIAWRRREGVPAWKTAALAAYGALAGAAMDLQERALRRRGGAFEPLAVTP